MRKVLILLLYRILPAAAFPLLLLYVVWRCLRDPRYFRRISERFGFLPRSFERTVPDSVWLHAVSVGEVLSSIQLIQKIREAIPGSPVFLSCTTLAGREVADTRLTGLVDGIFYAPIDYVSVVRRVLRRVRPAVVVVLETEIWPNLYREAKRSGAALVVVNGRISPKALPRYRRLAWFFRTVLSLPDAILVQSPEDGQRYVAAGAPPGRVHPAGNLKYDFDPKMSGPPAAVREWIDSDTGPLWIAASTVGPEYEGDVDEDDVVLDAWRQLSAELPGLRLMVAPRKPERFEVVAAKLMSAGLPFIRRSALPGRAPILLLDSLGELGSVFPDADVVFMGGTLADRGGHNTLEPASSGRAIVVGPHLENFAQIQQHFRQGGGFHEIKSAGELAPALRSLLQHPEMRSELGRTARHLADAERGATQRAVAAIVDAREHAVPAVVSYGPLKPLLWLLCGLWRAGGWVEQALARPGQLSTPVVSIGGLAMGGAGKTPLVRYLARHLSSIGVEVAVLTRGYRRSAGEPVTVIPKGGSAPVAVTGDEAQMILGDGTAHLGISSNRCVVGQRIEQQYQPDLFLLDDGFQHSSLKRDLDIVLLDGLDPFAGGFLFPRGRLREPMSALARAGAVVITRADGRRFDGVHKAIRSVNAAVPIYHAHVKPLHWVVFGSAEQLSPQTWAGQPVAAFCGLANPEAFRRTLDSVGCSVLWMRPFPDHHRYTPDEVKALVDRTRSSGTSILLTTEKDAVKLGHISTEGITLAWLAITLEVVPQSSTDIDLLSIIQTAAKVTNS